MMILPINIFNKSLAIAPRTECLETPIKDPKKTNTYNDGYNWNNKQI